MKVNNKKQSRSFPFYSKYNLRGNDEGFHHNNFFYQQEWWYYNVFFNHPKSELKDWSAIISFATYPHTDCLRLVLHDNNKQKCYGDSYLKPIDTLKKKGPAVNVEINNSYAKGRYPKWHVYANNTNLNTQKITIDLNYKANSLPIWLIKNTGLNQSTSPFGYYCIMNCDVKGKVTIKNKTYKVQGLGYHDHTWMPLLTKTSSEPKKKIVDFNIWDWFCIHFDNGWDIFVGKIHSHNRSLFSKIIPGSLCISPNCKKAIESKFFIIETLEYKNSKIPSLKIPTKIKIKTPRMNIFKETSIEKTFYLEINFEAKNIKENIPRDPPTWCQWEIIGVASGKIKTSKKTIKLNGLGIMETTRNIYSK